MEVAKSHSDSYCKGNPFPHIILDGLFDDTFLSNITKEGFLIGKQKWHHYDNTFERKSLNSDVGSMSDNLKQFFNFLNSDKFLEFLEKLSGYSGLIPDLDIMGGGMHQICRGGKLDIHSDFNYHYKTKNLRVMNCILFLNKDWKEEYGGHLELWDEEMRGCVQKVLPIFNRMVIFNTNDVSYHGHPDPLMCPEHMSRKSIAMYYYVDVEDKSVFEEKSRSTKYMRRPDDPYDTAIEEERRIRVIPRDKRGKK
jgi:Rps23 Pro-64 3,4-dihydroxylase Tpa1-like proline 4-hydroxylase